MKNVIYYMAFMAVLCTFSCTPSHMDKQELNEWLLDESNGLSAEKEIGGIKLRATFRPTDLLIDQSLRGKYEEAKESELRGKYEAYAYFVLTMEKGGEDALYGTSGSQADFSEKLQTIAFRMGDFVNITTSAQDTIPVADYAFPRTFGIAKSTSLMFAFNKEAFKNKEWVSFNLNEFGLNTGDQRFKFQLSDIHNTPKLKFQKI